MWARWILVGMLLLLEIACVPQDQYDQLQQEKEALAVDLKRQKAAADTLRWYIDMILPDLMTQGFTPQRISLRPPEPEVVEVILTPEPVRIPDLTPSLPLDSLQAPDEVPATPADSAARASAPVPAWARDVNALNRQGISVAKRGKQWLLAIDEAVLFESSSTTLSPRSKPALLSIVNILQQVPRQLILVEGHTDDQAVPSSRNLKDNWDLSVLRATSVVRELIALGIPPRQLIAAGRGDASPVRPNLNETSRKLNRRIEVIISPWEVYQ